jgi:CheY-like chemotaxis protein
VFEMFTQLRGSGQEGYPGLGIGLTLAKSLVEMHGGTIEVHSAGQDQGTEFLVRIPDCQTTVGRDVHVQPGAEEDSAPTKQRVLIVDDNQDAARVLSIAVRMLGHEVIVAHDGIEAVRAGAEFAPDVVLLDLGMPRMDGFEAAAKIRQLPWGKDVTLVALTGWGQDDDKRRTKEVGFDHHLVKPADPVVLKAVLATPRPALN